MGIVSRLKNAVTAYNDQSEAEANNREMIEKAEQEAYEAEKKKRKQQAEAEAKFRKAEAAKKAIEDARKRGEQRAKPISQKLDENIAKAEKVASGTVKTGVKTAKKAGKASSDILDAGGNAVKAAARAPAEVGAELRRIQRQTAPKKARPRTTTTRPQVVVVNAGGTATGTRRVKQPSKPVRQNPLAQSKRTIAQPHFKIASGGKGHPTSNTKAVHIVTGKGGLTTTKKSLGKCFATR